MSTHYRLTHQLHQAFDQLIEATQQLQAQLEQQQPECWMLGAGDPASSHHKLIDCLSDFWYLDGQDGRVTRSYPGLVACNALIWQQLGQVNSAKVAFSHAIDLIKRELPEELTNLRQELALRHQGLHAHLKEQGLARLHLKQTWRQLPGCEEPLKQIRLSWYSSGRSIRRISLKEAEYRLLQMNTEAPHIRIQLQKLAGLSPSEPLAQVQQQAPLMRANLFFETARPSMPERKAMNLALPLFVLSEQGKLPAYNQPSPQPPETRSRARRSDNQLEDTPFLPSIRVYRYSR